MIIKIKEVEYDRDADILLNGVEVSKREEGLIEDALRNYRKGRAFDDLLPLDQIEILYWAVGHAMENEYEAPSLKLLLRSLIIHRIKNAHINSFKWFELNEKITNEIVVCYEALKEQARLGLL